MNFPGYVRAPVLPLAPSPPCKGTPITASWMSKVDTVKSVLRLIYLKSLRRPPGP